MDGSAMKYGFGAIESLASDIQQQSTAIGGTLEDLRSRINSLAGSWQGDAQASFTQLKNNWDSAANDINAVMARISTAVQTTAQDARATESKNAGRFGA